MKLKKKKELFAHMQTIPDYRVDDGKIEYVLAEVIFMTLFGILKGHSTYKDIVVWMEYNSNNKILKRVFQKDSIDIPSKSTLHNIMINVGNDALENIFREFFSKHINKKGVAIDGKWLRGSDVNGQYTQEEHKAVLNVLDKETKIVYAHKLLDKDKKSEIPAFKELLEDGVFCSNGQIFSFDALLTQVDILNTIDEQKNRYIAKVKDNQLNLKKDIITISNDFKSPTDYYEDKKSDYLTENNNYVSRRVEVYQNKNCDLVMYHNKINNINSIIKVIKTITDANTLEVTTTTQYLIANFKTTAKDFKEIILQHWRVETYHYHLDMLTKEDDHIAYKDPFSMAILRSFTINLYQLFLNEYKDQKVLVGGKTTMAEIRRSAIHSDEFVSDLFEQ